MTPIGGAEDLSNFSERDLLIIVKTTLDQVVIDRNEDRKKIDEHTVEIRDLQETVKKAVTPKQLWVWLTSACAGIGTIAGTVISVVNWIGAHR